MTFHAAVRADALWVDEMIGVEVAGEPVLLLRLDDGVHAYADRCAHKAAKLSDGRLDRGVLTCAAHGWCFDACTGEGLNPRGVRLRPLAVKVEHGDVLVALEGE